VNCIEHFGPKYLLISGEGNFLADMFSRLPWQDNDTPPETPSNKSRITINNFSFILNGNELLECFLNLPDHDDIPFALDPEWIAQG
jgi:hypothetical protein